MKSFLLASQFPLGNEPPRWVRMTALLGGLVLTQFILYGPSLVGAKLLLPLSCLAHHRTYLPDEWVGPSGYEYPDWRFSDAILQTEPDRIFAVKEMRAGRIPLWDPHSYCGAPFLANNNSAVFSPFMLPSYLWPGPEVLAWTQMLRALVAGCGAYWFFRRCMGAGFFPALIGGYAYPLIGFLIFWTWIHHSSVVALLPWGLGATDAAVRNPKGWGGPCLALATALILLSGKLDTSGQVLLAIGLYAIWCGVDQKLSHGAKTGAILGGWCVAAAGWLLGFAIAALVVLPTYSYLVEGTRILVRRDGTVDFPPIGIEALIHLVVMTPTEPDRLRYPESAAAGHVGIILGIILAPLAWSGPRRSQNLYWLVVGFFAFVPQLGVPLLSDVYAVSPLSLFQNNRFAFLTAWCLIALAVNGLDALSRNSFRWRHGFGGAAAVAAVLVIVLGVRIGETAGEQRLGLAISLALAVGAAAAWAAFWRLPQRAWSLARPLALAGVAELIWSAYGFLPQADPALYYPPLPVFDALRSAEPARVSGTRCLFPNLLRVAGFKDVRGYDGSDPKRIYMLLRQTLGGQVESSQKVSYARTIMYIPFESPILDMLNVKYAVLEQSMPTVGAPFWSDEHYRIEVHKNTLPRPFVPRSLRATSDSTEALEFVARPDFDPRQEAIVTTLDKMPAHRVTGEARLIDEVPGFVRMEYDMQTPGLVVLSDSWFPGWNATVDGRPSPVYRVNTALMGVLVPAGQGTIELRYQPASFHYGVRLSLTALSVWMLWCGLCAVLARKRRSNRRPPEPAAPPSP